MDQLDCVKLFREDTNIKWPVKLSFKKVLDLLVLVCMLLTCFMHTYLALGIQLVPLVHLKTKMILPALYNLVRINVN